MSARLRETIGGDGNTSVLHLPHGVPWQATDASHQPLPTTCHMALPGLVPVVSTRCNNSSRSNGSSCRRRVDHVSVNPQPAFVTSRQLLRPLTLVTQLTTITTNAPPCNPLVVDCSSVTGSRLTELPVPASETRAPAGGHNECLTLLGPRSHFNKPLVTLEQRVARVVPQPEVPKVGSGARGRIVTAQWRRTRCMWEVPCGRAPWTMAGIWWVMLVVMGGMFGLLPETVVARNQTTVGEEHQTVCREYSVLTGAVNVNASSHSPKATSKCLLFRAPSDDYSLALNLTQLYGFWSSSGSGNSGSGGVSVDVDVSGGVGASERPPDYSNPKKAYGLAGAHGGSNTVETVETSAIGGTRSSPIGVAGNHCLTCVRIVAAFASEGDGDEGVRMQTLGEESIEGKRQGEAGHMPQQHEKSICRCEGCKTLPYLLKTQARVVKLTFKWLPSQDCGLRLVYSFQKRDDVPAQGSVRSRGPVQPVVMVVVPIVVLLFVVILCGVILQRYVVRMPREEPLHPASNCEHDPLRVPSHSPVNTEVVYRPDGSRHVGVGAGGPSGPSDPMEWMIDQRPQANVRPLYTNDEVANYPPQIARSLDGEDGYKEGHRVTTWDMTACGPPPNKTCHDGESPPPYRSQSVSLMDRRGSSSTGKGPAAVSIIRDSNEICYLSSNNNNVTRTSNLNNPFAGSTVPAHHVAALGPGAAGTTPGSHPTSNLTVYGHPPRTALGPLHLQQHHQLTLQEQSQLHHRQHYQQHQQHHQHQHQHAPPTRDGHLSTRHTTSSSSNNRPDIIGTTPARGPPPYSDVVNETNYDRFANDSDSDV